MRPKASRCIVRALCCALPFLLAAAASAQWLRSQPRSLDGLIRSDPRLFSNDAMEPVAEAASELDAKTVRAWDLFQIAATGEWQAYSNRSTGRVEMVEGAGIPWIPGTGNQLVRSDLAGLSALPPAEVSEIRLSTLERIARAFLPRVQDLLGVDPATLVLNLGRSGEPCRLGVPLPSSRRDRHLARPGRRHDRHPAGACRRQQLREGGELVGLSLHEYGHGLDANDGNGSSPDAASGESYGDFTYALQIHDSCVGAGFYSMNCSGYGDPCTACTGARDIDWANHVSGVPHTVSNFTQIHCGPGIAGDTGPCGKEGHYESYIPSEALWDFATRDLPGGGGTPGDWLITDRLWYLSRSTATQSFSWFAGISDCSVTKTGWFLDDVAVTACVP